MLSTRVFAVGAVLLVAGHVAAAVAVPTNSITIAGVVEAVIVTTEQVAFSVNVNGTIIVLPCAGGNPQAGCDELEPSDSVLIHAHFSELQSVDCEEYAPAHNSIVYDAIFVKQTGP
jgi:hypothetical protein